MTAGVYIPLSARKQLSPSPLALEVGLLPFLALPSFLSSLPLEVALLNPARGSGECCNQRGVGGGPAEIEFGAF